MSDLSIYSRACRERWPISHAKRIEMVEYCTKLVEDKTAKTKDKLTAIKILGSLDRLNLQEMEINTPKVHINIQALSDNDLLLELQKLEQASKDPVLALPMLKS